MRPVKASLLQAARRAASTGLVGRVREWTGLGVRRSLSRPGSARGLVLDVFTGARLDAGTAPDCGAEGTSMPRAVVAWQYAIAGSSGNMGSFRIS